MLAVFVRWRFGLTCFASTGGGVSAIGAIFVLNDGETISKDVEEV